MSAHRAAVDHQHRHRAAVEHRSRHRIFGPGSGLAVALLILGLAPASQTFAFHAAAARTVGVSVGSRPVEVGSTLLVKRAGTITALSFYKSGRDRGSHVATLWTASGHRLARVRFRHESASGWQVQRLAHPVAVQAHHRYVVSYGARHGHRAIGTDAAPGSSDAVVRRGGRVGRLGSFPQHRVRSAAMTDVRFVARHSSGAGSSAGGTVPDLPGALGAGNPNDRNCAAAPSSCGYPDASNTGAATTGLRRVPQDISSGPGWRWDSDYNLIRVEGNGAVLDRLSTTATVDVTASNVTISNSRFTITGERWAVGLRSGSNITVSGNTMTSPAATGPGRMLVAIKDLNGSVRGISILRNDISHASTGIQVESGLVQDNYVHDLGYTSGDHLNGFTSNSGVNPLVLRHNTFLNSYNQTDAISLFQDFGPQTNRVITDNLLSGGAYSLYAGANTGRESGATNITVTNNRFAQNYFGNGGLYGPATAYYHGGGNIWAGNYLDASGAGVPAP